MAKDWWEGEIDILTRRKRQVDKERTALEEGLKVWKESTKLVSDFESDLRRQMIAEDDDDDKPNGQRPSPEEKMYAQLDKMGEVIAGLSQCANLVEERGWNLLICAIGAELGAFQEAEQMLQRALRAAGFDVDEDNTPRLGRSASDTQAKTQANGPEGTEAGAPPHDDTAAESDNEVPPDLLVAHDEVYRQPSEHTGGPEERDDNDNDVPAEFLADHGGGDGDGPD